MDQLPSKKLSQAIIFDSLDLFAKKGVIKNSFPRSPSLKPDHDQFMQIDRLFENSI